MNIKCRFRFQLWPKSGEIAKSPLRIIGYETPDPIVLPDGTKTTRFTAKGNMLPDVKNLNVILSGEWETSKDKFGNPRVTFIVQDFEEEKPTSKNGTIQYLKTLSGVGKTTALNLYQAFGDDIFDVIEKEPERLLELRGFSEKKLRKLLSSYNSRNDGRKLYQFLYQYGVKDSSIAEIYQTYQENALSLVKSDPYVLSEIGGIGFYTCDRIAQDNETLLHSKSRVKAAILQILRENEVGGRMFSSRRTYPSFMYQSFLRQEVFDIMMGDQEIFNVTGNTYLPLDMLYLLTVKLTAVPVTEAFFYEALEELRTKKEVFISTYEDSTGKHHNVYRKWTALSEYGIAKKIAMLMKRKVPQIHDLNQRISNSENRLEMLLSAEQHKAVYTCLSNPVSIITGGPGTGKTSVQRVLLSTYETIYKNKTVLLAAPTGMAAKRMSESTGRPASTIHSMLGLMAGETTVTEETPLDADLLIVDEASMVDTFLMDALLHRISSRTQLVIVGDVDQLPSVGCGCVLKELIASNVIPTITLTNIFRQGPGSSITVNAARIKLGTTSLSFADDFVFMQKNTTKEIVEEVKKLYPQQLSEKGLENVTLLSAFRQHTESGVNELNPLLRNLNNPRLNDSVPHFISNGTTYYIGDKVMFTKNANGLINGDVGYIKSISNKPDALTVEIDFSGEIHELQDDDIANLNLAYATTVHKSQGSEFDTVIMVVDPAHSILLKRNLVYTGITRAKKKIFVIGDAEAFKNAIITKDSVMRRSQLARLIHRNMSEEKILRKRRSYDTSEQLQLSV